MTHQETSDKVWELLERNAYAAARKLLLREFKINPTSHWVLTQLGVTHYEQHQYQTALRWFQKSRRILPSCPLTLWNLAGAYDMLGKHAAAIRIYTRLLKSDVSYQDDPCWESQEWTDSMKANCVYRLAGCFEELGKKAKAEKCYREYLNLLLSGVDGLYPASDVIERIRKLHGAKNGNGAVLERRKAVRATLQTAGSN